MRIVSLLSASRIRLGVPLKSKEEAIGFLVDLQTADGSIADAAAYREAVFERERQVSTAVEAGIAVPHARCACVKEPRLALCRTQTPIDCGAMDKRPTDLFFLIAAPLDGTLHLEILSRLMTLLMDEHFAAALRSAPDAETLITIVDRFETERFGAPEKEKAGKPRILAVTACPTGIAHTYMAAEALEKAGRAAGIPVKAETQGAAGVKNALTPQEIASCEGVIVAADREVDLARFDGIRVLRVPVADAIRRPEELLREVADAPVYRAKKELTAALGVLERPAHRLYRQMMSGVSHMLPFVIGGGILTALGYLIDDPSLGFAHFGANTPVAAWLTTVGDLSMGLMLPVMAAFIAMAVADTPGFAPGFVGGMLAVTGATFQGSHGVSAGFLGALLAGFAAGYLMLGLETLCAKLPASLESIKPVLIYPVAGVVLIGLFVYLVNPVVGAVNEALYAGLEMMSERGSIALGAVLAGLMSGDMGGPLNKAAYVFGTSTLASVSATGAVGSRVMASVMIGGMVPPLATALATTFFGDRFTPDERRSGTVNYVLGLCFITEGAIPFAVRDPLRVLPACIAGSALAGALSMAFGCRVPAPHGGIFVLPVMHNAPGFVAALAAGSVLGMALLALLKPKHPE